MNQYEVTVSPGESSRRATVRKLGIYFAIGCVDRFCGLLYDAASPLQYVFNSGTPVATRDWNGRGIPKGSELALQRRQECEYHIFDLP